MQIKAASKQAGVSTASMGKFDARLPGEKPGERSVGPKRKDVGPVAAAPGQEGKKVSNSAQLFLCRQLSHKPVRLERVCNPGIRSADAVPGAAFLEIFQSLRCSLDMQMVPATCLTGSWFGPSVSGSGQYAMQARYRLQLAALQRLCQVLPAQDNIGLI